MMGASWSLALSLASCVLTVMPGDLRDIGALVQAPTIQGAATLLLPLVKNATSALTGLAQ